MKTITLTFGDDEKFGLFLDYYIYRAGSSWDPSQIVYDGAGSYTITATAEEFYRLGYDWALYQFPPGDKK